jgi:hypothetical protein
MSKRYVESRKISKKKNRHRWLSAFSITQKILELYNSHAAVGIGHVFHETNHRDGVRPFVKLGHETPKISKRC